MAHTCPICQCLCNWSGDMDNLDLALLPAGGCQHNLEDDCIHDDFEDYTGEDDNFFERDKTDTDLKKY